MIVKKVKYIKTWQYDMSFEMMLKEHEKKINNFITEHKDYNIIRDKYEKLYANNCMVTLIEYECVEKEMD